jgi:predicted Zn-dependent protease
MSERTYKAVLYSGPSKIHGRVRLANRHLEFEPADGQGRPFKWDEYSISASFEDELVGIHSTLDPDKSVFVQDKDFAAEFSKALGVNIQYGVVHWWSRRPFLAAPALTVAIFATTVLFLAFLRTQGKFFARFVTAEQEKAMGKAAMDKSFDRDIYKLPPKMQKDWEALLQNLYNQPDLSDYKWKSYIADTPDVNAFALPGAYVVFNSGFIQQAQSADEILGVLAHEAAHVTQRHSVQSIAGDMSANILVSVLFLGTSNIMSGLIYAADGLHSLQYSRAHELEADRLGVHYLQEAGLTTDGLYAFFNRKSHESRDTGNLSYLSTHPMDADRLKQIRRLDPGHAGRKTPYDLAALQKYLGENHVAAPEPGY